MRPILAHDFLDVVGRAVARLASLHVDDGAERALERAAAAGIEAGVGARSTPYEFARQKRNGRPPERREVVHEVVERLKAALRHIPQDHIEPFLGFSREDGNAQLAREIEVDGGPVEHRQAPRDVKSAERDRDARAAERTRDIERARILVGLHPHERQQAEVFVPPKALDQLWNVDAGVGLVDEVDLDLDVWTEHLPRGAIARQAVHGGERIRRNKRPPPPDDVSVIVVMGWFDQNELKAALCHACSVPYRYSGPARTRRSHGQRSSERNTASAEVEQYGLDTSKALPPAGASFPRCPVATTAVPLVW